MILHIEKLIVEGKHGVHPEEKETPQRFQISVTASVNADRSRYSDELTDTVDWSTLRDSIVTTVQDNSFDLIERLAQAIADDLLIDERMQKVSVRVDKLDAFPSGVPGIEIEAARPAQE